MNFTNDSLPEETAAWNFSGTTSKSWSGRSSSNLEWSTYLTISVQWVLFVVGSVGNLTVLVVLLWRRNAAQVGTQLFVGSLALADLGLMFSTVWIEAYHSLQRSWPFDIVACKLQFLWKFLTMNLSVWTLAAVSIDRYMYTSTAIFLCELKKPLN